MFAKLLKHEWRATRGIIGLLCVIILVAGLTIGCVARYMMWMSEQNDGLRMVVQGENGSELMLVLCVLLVMAAVIAVAVCCAGSLFYVVWRFYKSRFTDEGYLTFTLPVTNHQLLLSSITNCVVSEVVVMLTAFIAVGLALGLFLTAIPANDIGYALQQWPEVWESLRESLEGHWGRLALTMGSTIIAAFAELIVLMLAVTIGALIAKKHKILAAVGVYYGISMVQSFAYSMFALTATTTEDVNMLLSTPGIMGAVVAVGGYFLMHWLTSKKLNLT